MAQAVNFYFAEPKKLFNAAIGLKQTIWAGKFTIRQLVAVAKALSEKKAQATHESFAEGVLRLKGSQVASCVSSIGLINATIKDLMISDGASLASSNQETYKAASVVLRHNANLLRKVRRIVMP